MNIEAFLLCDCATDSFGKLNVLGAFETLYALETPFVHRACTIAIRIRFSKIEQGEHNMKLNVIDQDGKNIVPKLDGKLNVPERKDAESLAVNMILNLQGIKFEKFGKYRIDFALDGRQEATLPFHVRQRKMQQPNESTDA
jgi:hypothetical protein